jgi:hypothetical protein
MLVRQRLDTAGARPNAAGGGGGGRGRGGQRTKKTAPASKVTGGPRKKPAAQAVVEAQFFSHIGDALTPGDYDEEMEDGQRSQKDISLCELSCILISHRCSTDHSLLSGRLCQKFDGRPSGDTQGRNCKFQVLSLSYQH